MTLDNGPHIIPGRQAYLERRVTELKDALELAQQRIDDLEKALGIGDDLTPLRLMGFTDREARVVQVLIKRPLVSHEAVMAVIYAEDSERGLDVDQGITKVVVSVVRSKLRRLGITLGFAGHHVGWSLSGPAKARLARLVASRAALTVGRACDQRQTANRRPRMAMAAE